MSKYLGDFPVDQTIYFDFTTVSTTGAPTGLAGSPAICVYKDDDVSTPYTTGADLVITATAVTGLNTVKVVTTDAFFAEGHDYTVALTSGSVGGTSIVGYALAQFSIENRGFAALSEVVTASLGTESYAADGAVPTLGQAMFMIWSMLAEKSISGATLTCKKLDGSTTSMIFNLNSATAPTSITRSA